MNDGRTTQVSLVLEQADTATPAPEAVKGEAGFGIVELLCIALGYAIGRLISIEWLKKLLDRYYRRRWVGSERDRYNGPSSPLDEGY